MQLDLSLADAFYKALGLDAPAFNPKFAQVDGDNVNHRSQQGNLAGSPYYANDLLGKEYYLPVTVDVGNGTIPGTSTTYAERLGVNSRFWDLPYPIISAEMNVHVVDTELTERDGMVSELINLGGYKIKIRGFIVNQSNEFPEDDFGTMCRLATLKTPFKIINPMTDILLYNPAVKGETLVTVRSLRWPERPGVKHVREYELELMTDVPFNLIDVS